MISAGGGAEESIVARIRCDWKKFRDVSGVLFCGCVTWAVEEEDLVKLVRNDMMVRWKCNVSLKDRKSS